MINSFYYILGQHAGVIKKLRQTAGLDHLVDCGGCSLHTIANANRIACAKYFPQISEFADDIYNFFKRSLKRSHKFHAVPGSLPHKFKRNVETRYISNSLYFSPLPSLILFFLLITDGYACFLV
jgi:hypothetical protein